MSPRRLVLIFVLAITPRLSAASQEIVNDTVWLDTQGREIIAQGGSMITVGRVYHWYGYDIENNDVRLYTSTDFVNWTFQGIVYHSNSWFGRPDVMYNAQTTQYVMITEGPRAAGRNSVNFFTSVKATGSFVRQGVTETIFGHNMGDHSVFQDTDGSAYLLAIYDPSPSDVNGGIKIIKLTPDYLGLESVVASWENGNDHRESPCIMKRDGVYYLFTSWTHGWNSTATKYQKSATLGGLASAPMITLATTPESHDSFNTQNDFIIPITESQGTSYVYCGDRYSQFTKKGTGKNAWFPLTFNADGTPLLHGHNKWTPDTP